MTQLQIGRSFAPRLAIQSDINTSQSFAMMLISRIDLLIFAMIVNEALAPSLIKSQLEGVIKEKLSAILQRVVPTKGENTGMLVQDLGTDYFSMMEQMTITRWWPAEQMLAKNG